MSTITVTLEEHEARALTFSSDMGDMFVERLGCRRLMPRGLSPREIAVQKIESALERQETPDDFEAPLKRRLGFNAKDQAFGATGKPNPHAQRTWDPRSC